VRAWQVRATGEPEAVLHLVDTDIPEPGPGFVRIDVAAAAIGLPDVLMCRGTYPLTPDGRFTPGQEVCGTVAALGAGVDPSLFGRRVMAVTAFYLGLGGFAEHALAAADTCFDVPDSMTDDDAAGFTIPFHTGWIGLHRRARLQPGETLLVLGAAGGSGAAAVTLGQAMGAQVLAVAGGPDKLAFCAGLGADVLIDHRDADIAEAARQATDGHGVDVVYDPVGGEAAAASMKALANEGRHLLVGFASGSWASAPSHQVAVSNYSLVGVYAGAYDRARTERFHADILGHHDAGRLASIVTDRIRFDDLPTALAGLSSRTAMGKRVLVLD